MTALGTIEVMTKMMTTKRGLGILATFLFSVSFAIAANADTPSVGDPAPDFDLLDQDGESRSLEDYRDGWVALYFYPKDDTPGCTTEACEFRDDIFKYRRMGCQILGVSLDDHNIAQGVCREIQPSVSPPRRHGGHGRQCLWRQGAIRKCRCRQTTNVPHRSRRQHRAPL